MRRALMQLASMRHRSAGAPAALGGGGAWQRGPSPCVEPQPAPLRGGSCAPAALRAAGRSGGFAVLASAAPPRDVADGRAAPSARPHDDDDAALDAALAARLSSSLATAAAAVAAAPPALPPLPPLNLGYAADNLTLRRSHRLTTSRACFRRTLDARGLPHVSRLALQNCLDLLAVLHWNAAHGVRLFRVSSKLFPWSGEYALEELPHFGAISAALGAAGEVARATGQRLTTHPPHFVKLASPDAALAARGAGWLEVHARVFDLMGFEPSHWNKINIHVGGVYGSKPRALARFAAAFDRLSPSLRARLTLENDDRPNSYSVADLLPLHAACGIPLTFDLHHHAFCPGGQSREEALGAALATWPRGVRPVVHWSEPPECPDRARAHPHAHSAFVYGPISAHGREGEVDVMIESKAKEVALLLYRDEIAPRRRAADAAAAAALPPLQQQFAAQ